MSADAMICRLFHSRTAAHMAHLQTRSFAAHKALNEYYDEIVELADDFAETYQGFFGIMENYPDCGLPSGEPIEWLTGLRTWLKSNRAAACRGETTLENIHDSIVGLISTTLYKLRFLDGPGSHESMETPAVERAEKYDGMSKW